MRFIYALAALAVLTSCRQAGPATTVPTAPSGALSASDALELTPDQALAKATKKAEAWQEDARLVGVFWGVAGFETTSVVMHLFHSPDAGKLFLVESKLTTLFQKTREITDRKFTWPARLMGTLGDYPVTAHEVLETAKGYLPPDEKHPIAGLVLVKPNRFTPALWLVKAGSEKLLVHAESGKVLAHTDVTVPFLPF